MSGPLATRVILALMMQCSFVLAAVCPEKITSGEIIARKFKLEYLGVSSHQKIDGHVEMLVFLKENCRCGFAAPPDNGVTEEDVRSIKDYQTLASFLKRFRIEDGFCPPTEDMNANSPYIYCFRRVGEKCGK